MNYSAPAITWANTSDKMKVRNRKKAVKRHVQDGMARKSRKINRSK